MVDQIKQKIILDFRDEASSEFILPIIDNLITENILKDCMFLLTIDNPTWMDNLYRIIRIQINYQKQKNEKKLVLARIFYNYCDNSDILDNINLIDKTSIIRH